MTAVAILDDYQEVALSIADWEPVQRRAEVRAFTDHLVDQEALGRRLEPFDVVVAMRERTPFPAELLERLPRLRLLVTTGMANNSIDLDAARRRGVTVCGTEMLASSTAELAWALIMSVVRDVPGEDRRTRAGEWQRTLPMDLAGATLGVLGLGRLGRRVAAFATAFDMNVLAWSPHLTAELATQHGARLVSFDDLFERSDIVTVHVPLSDISRGLVGTRELQAIGPDGYLVNTSRGPIVDQDALVAALTDGVIGGAALDVYDVEPLPADHPLLSTPRTILSPHVGFVSRGGYRVGYRQAVEDIQAWLDGSPVRQLT